MEREAYGLPQNAYLDSPYGLAPTPVATFPEPLPEPIREWVGPYPVPQPQPQLRPVPNFPSQTPFPGSQSAPQPGSVPEWAARPQPPHQTPYALPSQQGRGYTVGKDIPLERLIDIQRKAESSGNYQALNREKKGNTASGAYQYTDATWNNYGGYPKAMLAPKEVQDRRFAEDIARRVNKYNGDMFKALAEHYLPAYANKPDRWRKPATFKVNGKTVTTRSVESYLRHVLKDSPYINQLDSYLEQHG